MSDDPGRPKEGSEQTALSNVHRGVSCGPGRTEGAGVQNEAHGGQGPGGSALSGIRVQGWGLGRGDMVGRVPALKQGRGRGGVHSLDGVHSTSGLGSRVSELGALQGQHLGREGADCWEGTRSQSAQRLPGMETCRDPAAAGVSQLSMHCGGHLQDLARLPVHGTL